jgi:hypothetical protein
MHCSSRSVIFMDDELKRLTIIKAIFQTVKGQNKKNNLELWTTLYGNSETTEMFSGVPQFLQANVAIILKRKQGWLDTKWDFQLTFLNYDHAISILSVCLPPHRIFNAWTNLYHTWYFINPSYQSACLYVYPSYRRKATGRLSLSPFSVLGHGSVNMFPRQRIGATIEELLDASSSLRSVSYQRRVCGSVCVSPYRC